jgi:hypothetical protein
MDFLSRLTSLPSPLKAKRQAYIYSIDPQLHIARSSNITSIHDVEIYIWDAQVPSPEAVTNSSAESFDPDDESEEFNFRDVDQIWFTEEIEFSKGIMKH